MKTWGERAGNTVSFWERTAKKFQSEPLSENLTTDICVIGAGIAGVTTAYLLAREGKNVVLVDDGPVGGGMTGRTTAHLTTMIDDGYAEIEKMLGEECSRLMADSHTAAINKIEEIVRAQNIDCDFERLDGYLFLPPGGSVKDLMHELEAIGRAGLGDVERVDELPHTRIKTDAALRFPRQAQFHVLKYLDGLTRGIVDFGGKIFTGSRVVGVKDGESVEIKTEDDYLITAHAAVVATTTPINDRLVIHSKQAPYASYVIALRVKEKVEHALYWDTGETAKEEQRNIGPAAYHYVRFASDKDGDVLIVGGEDHKTGQADDCDQRFGKLERWARARFAFAGEVTDRWSGQVFEPVDGAGYIGRNPGETNVYVATGFSGNGITYGTISGMLIVDLIGDRENRWAELYDPARKTLQPAALADYVKENANVAAQMRDYVTAGDEPSAEKIKNGEGAILRDGVRKIAAYRDENGDLHEFSAVCPHLKCIVRWDSCEKTWDCPCHGSRFDALGRVLNGPAISDLERVEVTVEA